jgi:hypothetical protein
MSRACGFLVESEYLRISVVSQDYASEACCDWIGPSLFSLSESQGCRTMFPTERRRASNMFGPRKGMLNGDYAAQGDYR